MLEIISDRNVKAKNYLKRKDISHKNVKPFFENVGAHTRQMMPDKKPSN